MNVIYLCQTACLIHIISCYNSKKGEPTARPNEFAYDVGLQSSIYNPYALFIVVTQGEHQGLLATIGHNNLALDEFARI